MSSEALHGGTPISIAYIAISVNITLCITAAFGNILILGGLPPSSFAIEAVISISGID